MSVRSSVPCLVCVFLHSLNKSSECLLCANILLHADIKLLWGKNQYDNTLYKGAEIPQYQVMEAGARGGAGKSLETDTDRRACSQDIQKRSLSTFTPWHYHFDPPNVCKTCSLLKTRTPDGPSSNTHF